MSGVIRREQFAPSTAFSFDDLERQGRALVARATAHKQQGKDGAGPTVEAVKQGDKIVRLIVTCSCGERIEIDCLYPAGG